MISYLAFFRVLLAVTAFVAILSAVLSATSTQTFAQTQLSPQMREKAQAIGQVCMADIRMTCANMQPGGGRILACLQSNTDKLSQPCKDALAQAGQFKASGR
jgi:hypothetical protein